MTVVDLVDEGARRARLRSQIQSAARVVAPLWPLDSFIAVNPLGGLVERPFEEATAHAQRWLGARGYRPELELRGWYASGRITDHDLRAALLDAVPGLRVRPPLTLGGRPIRAVDALALDLLHGPVAEHCRPAPRTAGERWDAIHRTALSSAVDRELAKWCGAYVDQGQAAWAMPERARGFYAAWRTLVVHDRGLRRLAGRSAAAQVRALPARAEDAVLAALDALGVEGVDRPDELRGQLARMPGWAGLARWRSEWAAPDDHSPALDLVDLVAVRLTYEALAVTRHGASGPRPIVPPAPARREITLDDRVRAVAAAGAESRRLGPGEHEALAEVLALLPSTRRDAVWLDAFERGYRDRLLAAIAGHRPAPSPRTRPSAQAVFCIDARSEGLRRHLEARGDYETLGFAGFFAVSMRFRALGSTRSRALCPVLVTPRVEVEERPAAGDEARAERLIGTRRADAGAAASLHDAKYGAGSAFTLAEVAGWFLGPWAAGRTFAPGLLARWRDRASRRLQPGVLTEPTVAAETSGIGYTLDERVLFAQTALTTMGLTEGFAPLVLLCGHGSRTENNPYAAALDCGACGGAHGGPNATVAAAILNDPGVRVALAEVGIVIPADTWFIAGEHDTTADRVDLLDSHRVPATHQEALASLARDLEQAGATLAAERAARLPAADTAQPARHVMTRGRDWAQVRPEWGLARNAAFIVGPRAVTAGLDLECRTFLHSYRPEVDEEGTALETILTAPMVVAQWINAQYYFSTVDPQVFGAGDKTLHNPLGGVGVLVGHDGEVRVGLPWQSVMDGERPYHEPMRLLTVVQAPLDRIEAIIARNAILQDLFGGRWVTLVARNDDHSPWQRWQPSTGWIEWEPASRTGTEVMEVSR